MAAWNEPRGPRVHPRNGHLPSEFEHVSTIVVRFPSNPTEGVEVPCFAQSPNLGASTMAMATQHSEKCISSIMPPKCPTRPDLSSSFPALSPRGDPLIFPDPYQSFPPWEDDLPYINFLDRAERGEDKDEVPSVPPLSKSKLPRFGPHQSRQYLRALCFFRH